MSNAHQGPTNHARDLQALNQATARVLAWYQKGRVWLDWVRMKNMNFQVLAVSSAEYKTNVQRLVLADKRETEVGVRLSAIIDEVVDPDVMNLIMARGASRTMQSAERRIVAEEFYWRPKRVGKSRPLPWSDSMHRAALPGPTGTPTGTASGSGGTIPAASDNLFHVVPIYKGRQESWLQGFRGPAASTVAVTTVANDSVTVDWALPQVSSVNHVPEGYEIRWSSATDGTHTNLATSKVIALVKNGATVSHVVDSLSEATVGGTSFDAYSTYTYPSDWPYVDDDASSPTQHARDEDFAETDGWISALTGGGINAGELTRVWYPTIRHPRSTQQIGTNQHKHLKFGLRLVIDGVDENGVGIGHDIICPRVFPFNADFAILFDEENFSEAQFEADLLFNDDGVNALGLAHIDDYSPAYTADYITSSDLAGDTAVPDTESDGVGFHA